MSTTTTTTYCEIREVADMAALRGWASAMDVPIQRHGTTLRGDAVYSATHGVTTRVCVLPTDQPPPLFWESPFKHM